MSKEYCFRALIHQTPGFDSGYIEFPFDVEQEFGRKGQVKVRVLFDNFLYRGSLIRMKTPCHIIGLNKTVRDAINKKAGDFVDVVLSEDTEERTVEIHPELAEALKSHSGLQEKFDSLSFTRRKELVVSVESAKRPETRAARIERCIRILSDL
jgi:hypothetical protein